MSRFIEVTCISSGDPILVNVSNVSLAFPDDEGAAVIYFAGGSGDPDGNVHASESYEEVKAMLTGQP